MKKKPATKAEENKAGTSASHKATKVNAAEIPPGNCAICRKRTGAAQYCHGCKRYVCDACNKRCIEHASFFCFHSIDEHRGCEECGTLPN